MTVDRDTPPPGRTTFMVGLGLAGFFTTAALLRPFVPWPEERAMRAKYEHFAAHKQEFDAVYIGSSRMLRAIDPRIVDAEVTARGQPFRSFNFGLDGMMALESDFVMQKLLELEPEHLRLVLFEANTWYGGFDNPGTDPHSQRSVFWHTPGQTARALETLWLSDHPLWERMVLAGTHIEVAAWNVANYGQGTRILGHVRGTDRDAIGAEIPVEEIAEARGYQPMEGLTDKFHTEGRQVFLDALKNYKEVIATIPEGNARQGTLATYNFGALHAQYRAVESHGAELVYVVMPGRSGTPDPVALHAQGHVPRLMHFNQPDRYPSIFEIDRRFDLGHLSRKGAEDFSRLLADSIVDELQRPKGN